MSRRRNQVLSGGHITMCLKCYVKYELLWNIHLPDYNNKDKRDSAILKLKNKLIVLELQVSDIELIRAKVKANKSNYRQVKIRDTQTSVAEANINLVCNSRPFHEGSSYHKETKNQLVKFAQINWL